jgi:hypothetical protein
MASSRREKVTLQKFDAKMRANAATTELSWHVPTRAPFQLVGFAWYNKDRVYRRMPVKPRETLPEAVDWLANHTAGGQIRFRSNSRKLSVRAKLAAPADMVHMPATGQCGFDCYVGEPRQQAYVSTTKYDIKLAEYECSLFDFPDTVERQITLNFPLYQGVKSVEIGLDDGASLCAPLPFALEKPVVIYGTSITQGGCATRPGMAYTNILSRILNVPIVNLGFSGSGRGEPEVARTIATIESPACLVLDYEANTGSLENLKSTLPDFIRILRDAHPRTPILVVSRIAFAPERTQAEALKRRLANRDYQRDTVAGFRKRDPLIFFKDGGDLLGSDFDECTVDGVHPTDLGFLRMAQGLAPVLKVVLGL